MLIFFFTRKVLIIHLEIPHSSDFVSHPFFNQTL